MKSDKKIADLNVFMIGIGGISMSGLAKILLKNGVSVFGSDIRYNDEISDLIKLGATIYSEHSSTNITSSVNLVVYSGAIKEDNPELICAKNLGIKIMERSEFLGLISQNFAHVIAISGTHGKTTTTAMIAEIFQLAGFNPTIHLGGVSVNLSTNTIVGSDEYLILEACEYRESFLCLNPETSVITNIESDHLDYYKDYESIKRAFQKFADNSQTIVAPIDSDIKHKNLIAIDNYNYKNLQFTHKTIQYDVYYMGSFLVHIDLSMVGIYNVFNSLYAIAVANHYNIPKEIIAKALKNFKGVKRRNEKIGSIDNIPVIIDYAHHPTEIGNSYRGILGVFKSPLVVFQPHTYTRTYSLFNEFIKVLSLMPNLILFSTYPARETEIIGGRAEDLADKLPAARFVDSIEMLIKFIHKESKSNKFDCVLILGAGDLAENIKNYVE